MKKLAFLLLLVLPALAIAVVSWNQHPVDTSGDALLIDDNGDKLLIDDSSSDILLIQE